MKLGKSEQTVVLDEESLNSNNYEADKTYSFQEETKETLIDTFISSNKENQLPEEGLDLNTVNEIQDIRNTEDFQE